MRLISIAAICVAIALFLFPRPVLAQSPPHTLIATGAPPVSNCGRESWESEQQDRIALSTDQHRLFLLTRCPDRHYWVHDFDIADVSQPKLRNSLPLDGPTHAEAFFYSNGRLYFVHVPPAGLPTGRDGPDPGTTIIDVGTWDFPVVSSEIHADGFAGISTDGKYLAYRLAGRDTYFDVTDPIEPKRLTGRPDDFARAGAPNLDAWRKLASRDLAETFADIAGNTLASTSLAGIRLWDLADSKRPRLLASLPVRANGPDVRLLASARAIVVPTKQGFALHSIEQPRFDLARLRESVARARLIRPSKAELANDQTTLPLEDAGILAVLDGTVSGVRAGERAALLSTYGLWLFAADLPDAAIAILNRAARLAPADSGVALNLAEGARKAAASATTSAEKSRLTGISVAAYTSYRRISGKAAQGAQEFAAFAARAAAATNVCDYVAAAYNFGQERQMLVDPAAADLTNDGRRLHFEIVNEGGPNYSRIETFDAEDVSLNSGLPENRDPESIAIVVFKGKYYVLNELDSGPVSVALANVGPTCRFQRRSIGRLVQGSGMAVCETVRNGEAFPEAPLQAPETEHDNDAENILDSSLLRLNQLAGGHLALAYGHAELKAVAKIDLDGSGRLSSVGKIQFSLGRICVFTGFAFLDNSRSIEVSRRNAGLLAMQSEIEDPSCGSAKIVRVGRDWMFDVADDIRVNQTIKSRRRLMSMKGETLRTLCTATYLRRYDAVGPQRRRSR